MQGEVEEREGDGDGGGAEHAGATGDTEGHLASPGVPVKGALTWGEVESTEDSGGCMAWSGLRRSVRREMR